MEREVGVGIGMGNTCKPMADSFQCMTKPTTIKKIKNFFLKSMHVHMCACLHVRACVCRAEELKHEWNCYCILFSFAYCEWVEE